MLRKFINNYFRKRLANYFREHYRNGKILSLHNSRNIGILWNPVDEGSIDTYEFVRKTFKERGISSAGVGHLRKEKQHLILPTDSGFSNNKNIGFSGKPLTGPGVQFMQEPFDILVDLSINKVLALEYLLVHSVAKFKVGWESDGVNYYDLNIDVSKQPNARYLFEQIVFYLEKFDEK